MDHLHKPYFPMFVNLFGKQITIIGGGTIALRRVLTLRQFNDRMTVIAPEIHTQIRQLADDSTLRINEKAYQPADLTGADIVIAATNDITLNDEIYEWCVQHHVLVNICSDQNKCNFYFPAVIQQENITIGITSSGTNHKKVKYIANKLRKIDLLVEEN